MGVEFLEFTVLGFTLTLALDVASANQRARMTVRLYNEGEQIVMNGKMRRKTS